MELDPLLQTLKNDFMKNLIYLILLLVFASCINKENSNPQNSTESINASNSLDEQKITETINSYFEGWMTGDTTKIGRAMHRTCQLKNIKDDDVIIFDRAKYLSFFKPRPRRQNAGGKIISINITDDIAAAKCEIFTEERLYTDYFNMMKIKDEWYIVDKIATNKLKSEK